MQRRAVLLVIVCMILAALSTSVQAATATWTGATSGVWATGTNWSTTPVPGTGDTAYFNSSTSNISAISIGTGVTVRSIVFDTGIAGSNTISAGTGSITVDPNGSIVYKNTTTGTQYNQTIGRPIIFSGAATIKDDNDTGGFNGDQLVLSGNLSGSGTLTFTGTSSSNYASQIVLSGTNSSFTGSIIVNAGGKLAANSNTALGNTTGTTTLNGGYLQLGTTSACTEPVIVAANSNILCAGGAAFGGTVTVNAGIVLTIATGGGNTLNFSGAIGGGSTASVNVSQTNVTYSGATPNTLSGKTTVSASGNTTQIALTLNKTGGATAIVQWNQNDQVADTSAVTLGGGTLAPNGHSETMGTLTLTGKSGIDFAGGSGVLHFAASNAQTWTTGSQMLIKNWGGSSTDNVYVGSSASALTSGQLAMVGFTDPAGQAAGLYRAQITAGGELVPSATAVQPINPPFDLSPAAQAARAAVYSVPGRANLSGASSPLKNMPNTKIDFFGDSITWLNGYVSNIQTALNSGAGTSGKNILCINHGDNGGGVLQVLNGDPGTSNGYGGVTPLSFATTIAADHPGIAVVFIGINDVWWRGTSASTFQQSLQQIVQQGQAANVKMVLATLTVHYEEPDGTNADDPAIDQFAQITRDVAAATGATLVDLRTAYIDYEQNNNWELQLDGSLTYQTTDILTYDGIHPNSTGNDLLADLISQGIYTAALPEPGSLLLFSAGLGLLLKARKRRP